MKLNIRIQCKKIELENGVKFNSYKLMTTNVSKNDLVYGSIKFYIKKELLEKIFEDKSHIYCLGNVSKVTKKEFTTKDGRKDYENVFHINSLEPLPQEDTFPQLVQTLLEEKNVASINEALQ